MLDELRLRGDALLKEGGPEEAQHSRGALVTRGCMIDGREGVFLELMLDELPLRGDRCSFAEAGGAEEDHSRLAIDVQSCKKQFDAPLIFSGGRAGVVLALFDLTWQHLYIYMHQ